MEQSLALDVAIASGVGKNIEQVAVIGQFLLRQLDIFD